VRITSLQINDFRNIRNLNLTLDDSQTLFVFAGNNGQGKTNILESVYLAALSKSFRARLNHDMIRFESDFATVKVKTLDQAESAELEIVLTRTPPKKVLKRNGVVKPAVDFIGQLPAVFFSPDDLSQMAFAPGMRRRYLDILLSSISRDYLRHLLSYQKSLKQRNALLRQHKGLPLPESELTFWDGKLAEHGTPVLEARMTLIEELEMLAGNHFERLFGGRGRLKLTYRSTIPDGAYETVLRNTLERDRASLATQLGPHRDDLLFYRNDENMLEYSSRGEWRSLVLSLKFAEIELLESRLKKRPILLLDDVFSELDDDRQKYLFDNMEDSQVFISTTHREHLNPCKQPFELFEVREGKII
jgi:DNA replication and repair protein RecF